MLSNYFIETSQDEVAGTFATKYYTINEKNIDTSIFNSELPVWFKKRKADTRQTISYQSSEKDYVKYIYNFLSKYKSLKEEFKNIPLNQVIIVLKQGLETIIPLEPDYIHVGATSDISIIFRFSINNRNFYLEVFFEENEKIEVHAVLNVFENRKVISSFDGTVKEMLLKINDTNKGKNIEEYYPNYELSGSFITEI